MKFTKFMFLFFVVTSYGKVGYDLTVVGSCNFSSSIPLQAVSVMYRHKDDLAINFANTRRWANKQDVPKEVARIIEKENSAIPGKVAFFTDCLWLPSVGDQYKKIPNSPIKIALSMVESTKIPKKWSPIINAAFDAVVVPDEWLVPIYQQCGVRKPIFVIPLSCFLDEFFTLPRKQTRNATFRFGVACSMLDTKNILALVNAFVKEFDTQEDVELHIVGGYGNLRANLHELLKKNNTHRIIFHQKKFDRKDYVSFISSLDCYVLISKGEGFSITPREALAAGVPCILSDNTAHKTLCKTGFVRAVPSNIARPSKGEIFGKENVGYNFDCKQEDVQQALRDVYTDYSYHLELAQKGRKWVKRYTHQKLKKRYLSLFKPSKIIFGRKNKVKNTYLMTNSEGLFKKYSYVFKNTVVKK